jgi:hypothetical protein
MQLAAAILAALVVLSAVAAAGQSTQSVDRPTDSQDLPEEIERLAREYRIQVYNAYRLDRSEYDRRRAAWDAVLLAWQESGRGSDDVILLERWLRNSTHYAAANPARPIAPAPRFGVAIQPLVADAPSPQPAAPGADSSPDSVPARDAPRLARSTPFGGLLPDWFQLPPRDGSGVDVPPPAPITEEIPPPPPALDPPPVERPIRPRPIEAAPFDLTPLPDAPRIEIFDRNPPPSYASSTFPPPSLPSSTNPTQTYPTPSFPPSAPSEAAAGGPRHPIAATELFGEFVQADVVRPGPDRPAVRVNLDELAARINGYNLALQAIDAELLRRVEYDATDVARILVRMEELLPNYENVSLYWNVVSERERTGLTSIATAGDIIASLANRIIRLRRDLDAQTDEPAPLRRVRQDLLDSLTRQLSDIAERFREVEASVID